ncbi:hypothetical protein Tco_0564443 [Tanacetum coccineum]
MTSCSQAVNKSPTHYPYDSARTFRVILFSIHSDEWKSFQSKYQTALRGSYALSWKPCQDLDDGVATSFQQSQIHYHMLMLKLQRHTFGIKILKSRKLNFPDDAKYEHVGQDTRLQDGKDDKDLKDKDLNISELKSKSKRKKAQGQRLHSMKEQACNKDKDKDSRTQCQSNLKKPKTVNMEARNLLETKLRGRLLASNIKSNKEARFKVQDIASGKIFSLKILSRTSKLGHLSKKLHSLFKYTL